MQSSIPTYNNCSDDGVYRLDSAEHGRCGRATFVGLGQACLHGCGGVVIHVGGGRGCDLGNEMWPGRVARFGQMDFVAWPLRFPLDGVTRIEIVASMKHISRRRQIIGVSPTNGVTRGVLVLKPNAAQRLDGRQFTKPVRCSRVINRLQYGKAISAKRFCQDLPVSP